jgi:chitin synthase
MDKFLKRLKNTRHYTFMYMSVWKVTCMFITLLVVTYMQQGSVENLFYLFEASFSERNIRIKEVSRHSAIIHEVLTASHIVQLPASIN